MLQKLDAKTEDLHKIREDNASNAATAKAQKGEIGRLDKANTGLIKTVDGLSIKMDKAIDTWKEKNATNSNDGANSNNEVDLGKFDWVGKLKEKGMSEIRINLFKQLDTKYGKLQKNSALKDTIKKAVVALVSDTRSCDKVFEPFRAELKMGKPKFTEGDAFDPEAVQKYVWGLFEHQLKNKDLAEVLNPDTVKLIAINGMVK